MVPLGMAASNSGEYLSAGSCCSASVSAVTCTPCVARHERREWQALCHFLLLSQWRLVYVRTPGAVIGARGSGGGGFCRGAAPRGGGRGASASRGGGAPSCSLLCRPPPP